VRVDLDGSVRFNVRNGHRGTDGGVLHKGEVISGGEFLVGGSERGDDIAFVRGALRNLRRRPIAFLAQGLIQFLVSRKALPFGPPRRRCDLL
jgi:hypothetical protein